MNCPGCMNHVPDGSRFCGRCGKPIPTEASEPPPRYAKAPTTSPYAGKPEFQRTRVMSAPPGAAAGAAPEVTRTGRHYGAQTLGLRHPTDIVFVFDVTGSMSPYITGLVNTVLGFTNDVESAGIDARLGLVSFRDLKCREPTQVHGMAATPEEFRGWLRALNATGGGDEPESAIDAGFSAIETVPFRADATRILVWITDASYHEPDEKDRTMDMLVREVVSRKLIAYVIGPDLPGYRKLTDCMGGILFGIKSNPEEFRRIIKALGKSISETAPRSDSMRAAAASALGRTRTR